MFTNSFDIPVSAGRHQYNQTIPDSFQIHEDCTNYKIKIPSAENTITQILNK